MAVNRTKLVTFVVFAAAVGVPGGKLSYVGCDTTTNNNAVS